MATTQQIKFINLGANGNGISYKTYQKAQGIEGAVIFARVSNYSVGGEFDPSNNTLVAPSYFIWANGIEYNVADAEGLAYVMEQVEKLLGDISTEGSVLNIINNALSEYEGFSAKAFVEAVDPTASNVTATLTNDDTSIGLETNHKLYVGDVDPETFFDPSTGAGKDYKLFNGDYYTKNIEGAITGYVYIDGTWHAFSGNVNAENVFFPNGVERTEAWGTKDASEDVQTDGIGLNLKELMELYLVKEKWPTPTTKAATINMPSVKATVTTPSTLSTYMTNNSDHNSFAVVGKTYDFNGLSIGSAASYTWSNTANSNISDDKKTSTTTSSKSTITGLTKGYQDANGDKHTETSLESNDVVATVICTDNFSSDSTKSYIELNRVSGFTGPSLTDNKSSNSQTVASGAPALTLEEITGFTLVEGENKLSLSWRTDAAITPGAATFTNDGKALKVGPVYALSNQDNPTGTATTVAEQDFNTSKVTVTKTTYNTTNFTVTGVYQLKTNAGVVANTPHADPTNGSNTDLHDIDAFDYIHNATKVLYMRFGAVSAGVPEIHTPAKSKYNFTVTTIGFNGVKTKGQASSYDDEMFKFVKSGTSTDGNYDIWKLTNTALGANDIQVTIKATKS